MAKRCVPCLGVSVKEILVRELSGQIPNLDLVLADVSDCADGHGIDLCTTGKKGRKRSQYQEFISVCMKSKNIKGFGNAAPAMKECAAQWRSRE